MEVLFVTLPIFLLIALGYLLRSFRGITREGIHALNNFVYWVSLPALILVSFWGINWFDPVTRQVLTANSIAVLGFGLALFIVLRLLPLSKKIKGGLFISGLVGNTVYMGFPIGQRALGEGSYDLFLAAATPHLVIGIALSILAIEWFVLRSHNPLRYLKDFLLNPLIIALAGGITLSVLEVSGDLVDLIQQPLTMLAGTASPIALVTLGAFLRGAFQFRLAGLALFGSLIKLGLFPFAMLSTAPWLGLSGDVLVASALASAMPTAVTAFVISEKYDAAPQLVATTLFLSTLGALGTITAWLLFF